MSCSGRNLCSLKRKSVSLLNEEHSTNVSLNWKWTFLISSLAREVPLHFQKSNKLGFFVKKTDKGADLKFSFIADQIDYGDFKSKMG